MQDYFDSSFGFSAASPLNNTFTFPQAGLLHKVTVPDTGELTNVSAYRFHDDDPLLFVDGGRLEWRVGDALGAYNVKCYQYSGGTTVGSPTPILLDASVLVYTWEPGAMRGEARWQLGN